MRSVEAAVKQQRCISVGGKALSREKGEGGFMYQD